MRKTTSAIALSLLLAVPACSEDGGNGAGGSPSATLTTTASPSPTTTPPPKEALDAALLVAADLGTGWESDGASDVDTGDDDASASASATASADQCDFEAEIGEDPQYGREVSLENEASGLGVEHTVEVFAAGEAASTMTEARTALAGCPTVSAGDDVSFTVTLLDSAPSLGEETLAYKMVGSGGAGTATFIAFRIGDVISSIVAFTEGSTAPEVVATGAAQKAETKLEAVLSGSAGSGTGTSSESPSASPTSS